MMQSPPEARRRIRPRISDTDWLLLRDLRRAIHRQTSALVQPGMTALDFGCGHQPYREMLEALGVRASLVDLSARPVLSLYSSSVL